MTQMTQSVVMQFATFQ